MDALIVLSVAGLLAASAFFFGADSRPWEENDRQPWWPGRRPARG